MAYLEAVRSEEVIIMGFKGSGRGQAKRKAIGTIPGVMVDARRKDRGHHWTLQPTSKVAANTSSQLPHLQGRRAKEVSLKTVLVRGSAHIENVVEFDLDLVEYVLRGLGYLKVGSQVTYPLAMDQHQVANFISVHELAQLYENSLTSFDILAIVRYALKTDPRKIRALQPSTLSLKAISTNHQKPEVSNKKKNKPWYGAKWHK